MKPTFKVVCNGFTIEADGSRGILIRGNSYPIAVQAVDNNRFRVVHRELRPGDKVRFLVAGGREDHRGHVGVIVSAGTRDVGVSCCNNYSGPYMPEQLEFVEEGTDKT